VAISVTERGYTTLGGSQWWALIDDAESTPELLWPRSIGVYDRMRRQDSQVKSVLGAVTLPIRRTPWRIDPVGARDEVVQLVADDLGLPIVGVPPKPAARTRDRFSWLEHLRLALLMLTFGHSIFEQVYRIDGEGRARLRKLGYRPASSIANWNVAADGGLVSVEQHGRANGAPPAVIPVDRLVVYVNEREGGNWIGASLLRPGYKDWLLKDRLLRVDVGTIERNGMGIPVYEGAEGEEDLTKGLDIATSVRSGDNSGAATPAGAKLRLMGVEGSLPQALPSIRYHDEQIARGVLAHFLNLGTQTGSWALGTTFADFFVSSLNAVADDIAEVASQHIVEDLVDINFGADEPAPRVVPDEIGSKQTATAQALKLLFDAGILRPDRSLEEAVRQTYDLPSKDTAAPQQPWTPPGSRAGWSGWRHAVSVITTVRAWWRITNAAKQRTATLDIYDEIGPWGTTAKDLVKQLRALDVDEIQMHVNSPGGDYFDGIAILNSLRDHPARVVATVDGLAASAASFIVMAADELVMARNSELMIHEAQGFAMGDSDTMRDLAQRLDHISEQHRVGLRRTRRRRRRGLAGGDARRDVVLGAGGGRRRPGGSGGRAGGAGARR
jgi:ATP-dependent protease ClpP protease subunit